MKAVDIEGGKWTKDNPLKLVKLGGSPTDNNAILFRKGQDEIVQPYVDKGVIKVVADQWVDNWDAANALKLMENILTAQKNKIDAVVASNDGTALGALQGPAGLRRRARLIPAGRNDRTAASSLNAIARSNASNVSRFDRVQVHTPAHQGIFGAGPQIRPVVERRIS